MKKVLKLTIALIIILTTLVSYSVNTSCKSFNLEVEVPLKVAVLLYKANDTYIAEVSKNLVEIQKQNQGKVEFIFFDGNGDQKTQNESLDMVLKEKYDLLFLNLVDINSAKTAINKIKQTNIPVVLYNREPNVNIIREYTKAIYIGSNIKEGGDLQGDVVTQEWNNNKGLIDKNRDGIMQYIMLEGDPNNPEAIGRTKYSVQTIHEAGIKTEQLGLEICNWNRELAHIATTNFYLRFGDKIEVIIANNDEMAIGAIQALQTFNSNKGDKNRTIPVVGVDAIPEAQDYIKKGFMAGTVIQDANAMAKAMYIAGMNLISGKVATYNTEYKFDETGVIIRIPYKRYEQK